MLTAIAAFVGASVCNQQTKLELPKDMGAEEFSVLPNKDALVVMSMGQQEFLADLIWIRALQYNSMKNEAHLVENFADAIIALDPNFKAVYQWASVSCIFVNDLTPAQVEKANHYLDLGAKQFPMDYYYDYSIAINNISFYPHPTKEKEKELRAQAIERLQVAMLKPNADPNISMLISGMLNDDDTSAKIEFLQKAVLTESDPVTRNAIQKRLVLLSNSANASYLVLAAKREQYHRDHYHYLPPMLAFMLSSE